MNENDAASELSFRNETDFFNQMMVYQDSMKPSDVGIAGNMVLIGFKLLEEQCPSCRQAMSQQLRVLYGNLPKYYKNHPEKKKALFALLGEEVRTLRLSLGDKELGVVDR